MTKRSRFDDLIANGHDLMMKKHTIFLINIVASAPVSRGQKHTVLAFFWGGGVINLVKSICKGQVISCVI